MKNLVSKILLISIVFLSGCTLVYDSRNQNTLDIGSGEYSGANIKDGKFKTGRYIEIRILNKGNNNE